VIDDPGKNQHEEDTGNNEISAAAIAAIVVLLRIHQRHDVLSIIESGKEEKVPKSGRQ
jgi:hypothetical protein